MKALIAIANGIEEMETVVTQDLLVRAGIDVWLVSVEGLTVTAARGLALTAQKTIEQCQDEEFDIIICPGGLPGAENLRDSELLTQLLRHQHKEHKWIGAICASPAYVLAHHGLLVDHVATCYPGNEESIPHYDHKPVVTSGHIITSQGPGTAMAFALEIISKLKGDVVAREVAATALIAPIS